ncbi:MAG: CoA pyrophosphatase, partial [Nitriliruptor sp.]
VVLAPGTAGLDIAFIERVVRPGDRWSGQMALPGGKREPADPDLATTAARETAEEVGLDVGEPIGRLADQRGRVSKGMVAAFVFGLDDRPALRPQPSEVAAADWIALSWLYDPANVVRRRWVGVPFPGFAHRDRVIWGLTHRILDDLGSSLGLALPRP